MSVKIAVIAIAIPVLATAYVMLFYGRVASQETETVEQMVTEAKDQAVERFRNLRKPSQWQKLLMKKLGPLKFGGTPTAGAAKVVAGRLGLGFHIAPGVESTVTYNKDGTLGDFVQKGLNPQYWYLTVEDDKLYLKPFVKTVLATVSSEQGLYYSEHLQELEAIMAKCGSLAAYRERLSIDAAGAVTIHGRVWFIDRVIKELGIGE
ncbi:hypothetical protein ACFL6S_32550 [Candidatus Poribacteria bacterium]